MPMKTIKTILSVAGVITAFWASAGTQIGGLITNQTWTVAQSPYTMTNDVTVSDVLIQAGVTIESQSNYQFVVAGLIVAKGSIASPITFKPASGNPSWQGIYFQSASPSCVLSNCLITGAINSGIRILNTPLTLNGLTLLNNQSTSGGGIASDSTLVLEDCVISNCIAYSGGSARGGGIWLNGASDKMLTLRRCQILHNSANFWGSCGGGVACDSGPLVVQDCNFINNSAFGHIFEGRNIGEGGAVWAGGPLYGSNTVFYGNSVSSQVGSVGGAIRAMNNAALLRCSIIGNSAYTHDGEAWGGGFQCGQTAALNACVVSQNSIVTDFAWTGRGAGIYCAHVNLTNCILAGNAFGASSQYHLGNALYGGVGSIVNCTIANNNSAYGPWPWAIEGFAGTVQNSIIFGNDASYDGAPTVNYSLVQGIGSNTNYNFDLNPLFVDTTNYFLFATSPAIDAGDPDVAFNDLYFPPSLGTSINDLGAYGGPLALPVLGFVQPLNILMQPTSQIVDFGSTVTFNVAASGGYGSLGYQWQLNGVNITGATNHALVLPNVDLNTSGSYSVIVENVAGTMTSSAASLTVTRMRNYAGLTISGIIGRNYLIQYTTDIGSAANWTTLTNVVLSGSPSLYFDVDSPDAPARFYRFVLLP